MDLRAALSDWNDSDGAAFSLGQVLGVIPEEQNFTRVKYLFWTDNPLGNALHRILLELVVAGVLEERDDQFRWAIDPAVMVGTFRLKQAAGGVLRFADVTVQVEASETDEVLVSDAAFDWRREVYGPNAGIADLPADRRAREEAVEGAWYVLRRQERPTGYRVTVTKIVDSDVDTGVGDVKFAAIEATCRALGIELDPQPFINVTGPVFPD